MSDEDAPQAIDLDAVAEGLKLVRMAVPELPFVTNSIPPKLPAYCVDDLGTLLGALNNARTGMERESEGLANEITIIALNTHAADRARIEAANAPSTGTTTTSTTTVPTTSVPAPAAPERDGASIEDGTAPPTGTTVAPPPPEPSATTWEGSYADVILPAKDSWLTALNGVDQAATDAATALTEWAARAYEVGESMRTHENNIDWYGISRDPATGLLEFQGEIDSEQEAIELLDATWTWECAGFSARLADPITTLNTAAALESIPGGPISGPRYFVEVSYLIQLTGVSLDLVDPERDFEKAAAATLAFLREHPELFTILDAVTNGTIDQADNEWATINFEMARDNPALMALMLREYADEFGTGWTDEQLEVMVAQLMTAGAVLMTAKSDGFKEFDDEWIDPRIEDRFREMAHTALEGGYPYFPENVTPAQWDAMGNPVDFVDLLTPNQIRELLRGYAEWLVLEEMSTVELLLDDFKTFIFDHSVFFGDDASAPGAAIEIIAILPVGDLAKIFRHADEAAEAAQQASRAVEAATGAARAIDPDDITDVIEEAAEIGESAVEHLDDVDLLDNAATLGIDINSADNGVFLPANRNSSNPNGAAVHSMLHTNEYYQVVNRRLALAETPEEARAILKQIEDELLQGTFP